MDNHLHCRVVCILVVISTWCCIYVHLRRPLRVFVFSLCLFYFSQVIDLVEVMHVASIDLLRSLNLRGNPLRELPDYRLSVIFTVQQLTELDTQHIDIAEKV